MNETVADLPEAVLVQMEKLGSPVRRYLNEGADARALDVLRFALKAPLFLQVREILSWHDGTRLSPGVTLGQVWLVPGYFPASASPFLPVFS